MLGGGDGEFRVGIKLKRKDNIKLELKKLIRKEKLLTKKYFTDK